MAPSSSRNNQRSGIAANRTRVFLLLGTLLLGWASGTCKAGGSSFGFSIHHGLSDPVRAIFPAGDDECLQEKGTVDYFAAMVERDQIHGRRLATGSTYKTPLTFIAGNSTFRYSRFAFLYYANVSIGTPGLDFLVALDTGSDLLWLPCDCISCYKPRSGEMKFNVYGLNTSSTGKQVPCSSPMCDRSTNCVDPNQCPYQRVYLSDNMSTSGYLVEDVLHLTTDSDPSRPVNATITFGCGRRQTGPFLEGVAPNGLFGLGIEKISVPSTLARQNITANSFSMCFAPGGIGRISFGDNGTSDQAQTPFTLRKYVSYFVGIPRVVIGRKTPNVDIDAVFDTGTSFTYFTDLAYTVVTEAFNSQVRDKRLKADTRIPFEFCYEISSCSSDPRSPSIKLMMGGGTNYRVVDPLVFVITSDRTCFYCLGVLKEETINIIGENFMTGYRIVFDHEKMVLGWKESDCNYAFETTTTLPPTYDTEAIAPATNTSKLSGAPPATMGHQLYHFKHWALALSLLSIQILAIL